MATTNTRIDVRSGTLSMAGSGQSVTFSVFNKNSVAPDPLVQNCSYVKMFDSVDEDDTVHEFLANLHNENDIIQEFLANLVNEDDVVHDFLADLQSEEEVELDIQIREKGRATRAMGVVKQPRVRPSAATIDDVIIQVKRQLKLQSEFG